MKKTNQSTFDVSSLLMEFAPSTSTDKRGKTSAPTKKKKYKKLNQLNPIEYKELRDTILKAKSPEDVFKVLRGMGLNESNVTNYIMAHILVEGQFNRLGYKNGWIHLLTRNLIQETYKNNMGRNVSCHLLIEEVSDKIIDKIKKLGPQIIGALGKTDKPEDLTSDKLGADLDQRFKSVASSVFKNISNKKVTATGISNFDAGALAAGADADRAKKDKKTADEKKREEEFLNRESRIHSNRILIEDATAAIVDKIESLAPELITILKQAKTEDLDPEKLTSSLDAKFKTLTQKVVSGVGTPSASSTKHGKLDSNEERQALGGLEDTAGMTEMMPLADISKGHVNRFLTAAKKLINMQKVKRVGQEAKFKRANPGKDVEVGMRDFDDEQSRELKDLIRDHGLAESIRRGWLHEDDEDATLDCGRWETLVEGKF